MREKKLFSDFYETPLSSARFKARLEASQMQISRWYFLAYATLLVLSIFIKVEFSGFLSGPSSNILLSVHFRILSHLFMT